MRITRNILCTTCKGTGSKDGKGSSKCAACDGQGVKVMLRQFGPGMFQQIRTVCPDCEGKGETLAEGSKCKDCNGKKTTVEKKVVNVEIDKGVREGKKIVLSGESDQEPGVETGDVIFVIQEEPHAIFKRSNDDLIMEKDIPLIDALIGFAFKFNHLDERPIIVQSKRGDIVKPGDIKELPNLGMPVYTKPYEFGSLIVKFNVVFPVNLNNDQLGGLKSIFTNSPTPQSDMNTEKVTAQPYDLDRLKQRMKQQEYQRHHEGDDDSNGGGDHGFATNCTQQ